MPQKKGCTPWNKGKKLSKSHIDKISKSHIGQVAWNKGKKGVQTAWNKGKKGSQTANKSSFKKNMTPWNKGKKTGITFWKGKKRPDITGKNCHLWKGGITPINQKIRTSAEYKLWREAVFKRDKYTCVFCGLKSGDGKAVVLNADHIKPFALFPELRFAIDNGRTLCEDCHRKTSTYGGNSK